MKSAREDLNLRPTAYRAGALPTELRAVDPGLGFSPIRAHTPREMQEEDRRNSPLFTSRFVLALDDLTGAARGARTLDLQRGMLALYQLSYYRVIGARTVTPGVQHAMSGATRRVPATDSRYPELAEGLEPPTRCLRNSSSTSWSYASDGSPAQQPEHLELQRLPAPTEGPTPHRLATSEGSSRLTRPRSWRSGCPTGT
jgi:hypothetical protein